ncbi:c-type cytochrome biogenesis protein CcsB [Effusibacillus lacus]|uniref:C-type cytochrome biogenesis protein CcsB n=1 Tax=Effusibacillus lacus TaxID=1348429 RepID=A0A292YTR8_9BACL|nr:c-type cytochrome biogenesis protein CcsB [Effusibacillus lacus]TCS76286.1 cytochrome c-type biogenesis protein CcsB [Effusibacillus lacus]GAX91834.1 c-type cytochrome biogenesis protein CcsB [Effusibacillus lacus]
MLEISAWLYWMAFFGYFTASVLYIIGVTGQKIKIKNGEAASNIWTRWGYIAAIGSVLVQLAGFVTRWIGQGHAPTSNMFEYMSFWAWCIMLAFVIISAFYNFPILGAFAAPTALAVLGYANVFPDESQALIPALKSYWLYIHVTTAALGEGVLTIAFAAALMHLLVVTDLSVWNRKGKALEFVMFLFIALVGFVTVSLIFKAQQYTFVEAVTQKTYELPPLVGPTGTELGSLGSILGIPLPLFNAPSWVTGEKAFLKLNTLVWTLLSAIVIYYGLRFINRKPLVHTVSRWVQGLDAPSLDELSYRAVAIGYPIFTLGALVFAMIWAQEAWGSYWSWDPKETWALITWLYYTAYLHLRLTRGWEGERASWMAVAGFVVILFLLVGVNFLIVGLHAYA